MQIWYNSSDMVVQAVYSGEYNGTVWADKGYAVYTSTSISSVPKKLSPGAVIGFDSSGNPFLVSPKPPDVIKPKPDYKTAFQNAVTIDQKLQVLATVLGLST